MQSSSNLILVTLSVLYAETLKQQNWLPSIDVEVLTKQKASQWGHPLIRLHTVTCNYSCSLCISHLWSTGLLDLISHSTPPDTLKKKCRERGRNQLTNICRNTLSKTNNLCGIRRRIVPLQDEQLSSFRDSGITGNLSIVSFIESHFSSACRSTRTF